MKKLLVTTLIVLMLFCLMAVGASATEEKYVMTVDGKGYTDFQTGWNDALAATANNDNVVEVILYADWSANNGSFGEGKGFKKGAIYISEDTKDMSIDLNGHTVDRGLFSWDDYDTDPDWQNATASGEVIHIDEDSKNITFKNGTIRGAKNANNGGVYVDEAEVLFENITFVSNLASYGGALYGNDAEITVKNCRFERNVANTGGGAISGEGTDYYISDCTIIKNHANRMGGAIHSKSGMNLDITNTVFESNKVTNHRQVLLTPLYAGDGVYAGGAIYMQGSEINIDGCEFNKNSSANGGAIYQRSDNYIGNDNELSVKNSKFDGNFTVSNIFHHVGEFGVAYLVENAEFINCSFTNNSATNYGCFFINNDVKFKGCTFTGNSSGGTEGQGASAIYIGVEAEVVLTDCKITDNTGTCAIFNNSSNTNQGELWLDGECHIIGNKNANGDEMNVCIEESGLWSTSIFMKRNFSKNSRVGVGINGSGMLDECAVEDIPDSWTDAELAACFTVDDVFNDGSVCNYYLTRDGSALDFTDDPDKSIHATSGRAASIIGDGSGPMIISLLSLCVSIAGIIYIIATKKNSSKN